MCKSHKPNICAIMMPVRKLSILERRTIWKQQKEKQSRMRVNPDARQGVLFPYRDLPPHPGKSGVSQPAESNWDS